MTDNKRLEAIKAKAEGMGLEWYYPKHTHPRSTFALTMRRTKPHGYSALFLSGQVNNPDDLATAHTLLAALDPEAVRVEINPIHNCYHCDLFNDTNCKHLILNPVAGAPVKVPGPDCPAIKMPLGEDEEYILVRRKVVR